MTKIEVINDYFIEVDNYNHTLKKKCVREDKKTGEKKPGENTIGYYRSVQECLEAIVRLIPLDENNNTTITLREYAEAAEWAFKRVEAWRNER